MVIQTLFICIVITTYQGLFNGGMFINGEDMPWYTPTPIISSVLMGKSGVDSSSSTVHVYGWAILSLLRPALRETDGVENIVDCSRKIAIGGYPLPEAEKNE